MHSHVGEREEKGHDGDGWQEKEQVAKWNAVLVRYQVLLSLSLSFLSAPTNRAYGQGLLQEKEAKKKKRSLQQKTKRIGIPEVAVATVAAAVAAGIITGCDSQLLLRER